MKIFFFVTLISFQISTFSAPFSAGSFKVGKELHDKNCISCHNGMMPDNKGNDLYLPEFRSITTSVKLNSQVEFCANQNDLFWFEEEIESVSKFLNESFYKFTD